MRDRDGVPLVIRNAPVLEDGTPMPTRYWLVGKEARLAVDRLEAAGGVRAAEAAVDPEELARAHANYAAEREAAIPAGWGGPRPSGGVGGTKKGVKCLHAHYAWYLAGGDDPVGRWVARQLAGSAGEPAAGERRTTGSAVRGTGGSTQAGAGNVAAIDCGSLSTRLLVAGPGKQTLVRLMRITGLSRGVDSTGEISPIAAERTLSVLREYREVMDRYGVQRAAMVGTSALRDAANRSSFSHDAEAIAGTSLRLLRGEEEAALSFLGATSDLLPASGPWLVTDIGGGSTELAAGPPLVAASLDLGCVRVSERFFDHDPPARRELEAARSWLGRQFEEAEAALPGLRGTRSLVGLAGTVAALACFDQSLSDYSRQAVHHYRLSRGAVAGALRELAAQPASQRAGRPGIEPARAPYIVGGALVLDTLMAHFGFAECLASESDILDGLVIELLGGPAGRPQPGRRPPVRHPGARDRRAPSGPAARH